jgi:hypothetical protein
MTTPGLMNPTTIGRIGTPREAAIAEANNRAASQTMANRAMAGGKYRRFRGGASNGIPVAQFNMPYKEQNGPGTGINDQYRNLNQINTQAVANSNYDNLAAIKKGGFSYKKKPFSHKKSSNSRMAGGNPDWSWGCYSGGKHRKTRRNSRKSRKRHRKSRKH